MLKKYNYTKADGSTTPRTVYEIAKPSDMLLAIDLSEFSPPERDEFEAGLQQLYDEYLTGIEQLGLGNNWRYFKTKGMTPRKEV